MFLGEAGLIGEPGRQGLQGFPGPKGKTIMEKYDNHKKLNGFIFFFL